MDIIICIIYIFIGVRWIFKNIRLGTFSACTTWKIYGVKAFHVINGTFSIICLCVFRG